MNIYRFLIPAFTAEGMGPGAPAGDGGGAPEGKTTEGQMYGHNDQQPGTTEPEPPAHVWKFGDQRPDWLPEKFAGKDGTVDLSKVFESYSNLESKMSTRNDHLRTQIMDEIRQGVPEEYDTTLENLPDGFEFQPDPEDPLFQTATEIAKEAGMNQEQFSKLLEGYVQHMASMLPDHEAEMGKLGDNAQARIEGAVNWMNANMPKGIADWFSGVADTAEAVEFLEWVQAQTGEPNQNGQGTMQSGTRPQISEGELRSMMQDPRYHDPNRRDPNFVRQVQEGWQRLYG